MNKLIFAILILFTLPLVAHSAPGGFNQSLDLFDTGRTPDLNRINAIELNGGCYTEFSPVEFTQEFIVSFKKVDSQYNLEFFNPKKNETSYFNNLIISKVDVQTQKQWLSPEAFFKMSYKENGKYLIEKISLHDVKASAEMILNMCYYNL